MMVKTVLQVRKVILLLFIIISISPTWGQELSEVPIITVLDFASEDVSKSEARLVISMLSTSFYKTGRFKVIDISQRDTLAKELSFSISGCSDESCQLELGRMLAAELIVVGTIGKIGSRYVLSSKILETSSGATYGAEDGVYTNIDAMVDDLDAFVSSLASDVITVLDNRLREQGRLAQATPSAAASQTAPAGQTAPGAQPAQPAGPGPGEPAAAQAEPSQPEGEQGEPESIVGERIKKERPPREPREPREPGEVNIGGPLAIAGGLLAAGIGGFDFVQAGGSAADRLTTASETYSSAAADFDDAYLAYQTEYASWKETASWGIGWTAGGAALTGLGLFLTFAGQPSESFAWQNFFLDTGGAVSLVFGVKSLMEAAGSLSREVERTSTAYIDATSDFNALYADYKISLSERSSAFWNGLLMSTGGLASLTTGIILGVMEARSGATASSGAELTAGSGAEFAAGLAGAGEPFHWPGFLLLAGGAGALYGSAYLLAEAAGPLSLAAERSAAIYLNGPDNYDLAYSEYRVDFQRRNAAGGAGIGLGAAGLGLAGLGVWQYFFTQPPASCADWPGWLITGSGLGALAWGTTELLIAALSLTPEVNAAAEAYTLAGSDSDFDLLYGTYEAAAALREETLLKGAVLAGTGLIAGTVGAVRLIVGGGAESPAGGSSPDGAPGGGGSGPGNGPGGDAADTPEPLSWMVLPVRDGFGIFLSWSR